ncbi:MAG: hypothetical protein HY865_22225 [Chloroflexi bacterium]|nr:hypothetical protein [Chloroflexota bacterium]
MAKIYSKFTWLNEILAGLERFNIKQNDGTPIYSNVEISLNTSVTQAGTSVDATRMNHLEDGLDALDTKVAGMEVHSTTEKTSIANDDEFSGADSAASYAQKRWKWSTIISAILSSAVSWYQQAIAASVLSSPDTADKITVLDVSDQTANKTITLGKLADVLEGLLIKVTQKDAADGVPALSSRRISIWDSTGTYQSFIRVLGTAGRIFTLANRNAELGNWLNNCSVEDQVLTAATKTYIEGSLIAIPDDGLRIGTVITWRLVMTKTAAGVATTLYEVLAGLAGTVSDGALLSFTKGAGTAAVDTAEATIELVIRGPLTSGYAQGMFKLNHQLATTGFYTLNSAVQQGLSSAVDLQASAIAFIGIAMTTGASEAVTIKSCTVEARNL